MAGKRAVDQQRRSMESPTQTTDPCLPFQDNRRLHPNNERTQPHIRRQPLQDKWKGGGCDTSGHVLYSRHHMRHCDGCKNRCSEKQ